MKRIYTSEQKQFINEKSFEFAQAQQRFQNTWSWYQSNPTDEHLASMKRAHKKIEEILDEVTAAHGLLDTGPSSLRDPEPGDHLR